MLVVWAKEGKREMKKLNKNVRVFYLIVIGDIPGDIHQWVILT